MSIDDMNSTFEYLDKLENFAHYVAMRVSSKLSISDKDLDLKCIAFELEKLGLGKIVSLENSETICFKLSDEAKLYIINNFRSEYDE